MEQPLRPEISSRSNLLEQKSYKYSRPDVQEPNLPAGHLHLRHRPQGGLLNYTKEGGQ